MAVKSDRGNPRADSSDRKRIELCSEHGCSHTETQTNQHHRCLSRRLRRKFYGELLDGIKKGLELFGYEMIVCSGKKSHLFIPERMVDGAIILDWTFPAKEIEQYAQRGHQIVVLDRVLSHENIHQVLLDNKGGAALAIDRLIAGQSQKSSS